MVCGGGDRRTWGRSRRGSRERGGIGGVRVRAGARAGRVVVVVAIVSVVAVVVVACCLLLFAVAAASAVVVVQSSVRLKLFVSAFVCLLASILMLLSL